MGVDKLQDTSLKPLTSGVRSHHNSMLSHLRLGVKGFAPRESHIRSAEVQNSSWSLSFVVVISSYISSQAIVDFSAEYL